MHSFSTTVTIDSKVLEGVRFKIRRLSAVQRANRDLKIVEPQVRIAELNERIRILDEPYLPKKDEDGKELPNSAAEMPLDVRVEKTRLDREMGCLINAHVKPATIRVGFVSAEGFDYDGEKPTAELILANGPDELIDEIWLAIVKHSQLSTDEKKVSPLSGTSGEPADGPVSNSTANAASATSPTNSNAETADAIFPNR